MKLTGDSQHPMRDYPAVFSLLISTVIGVTACAQPPGLVPPGDDPSGNSQRLSEFDTDGDGLLNNDERAIARAAIAAEQADRPRRGGRPPGFLGQTSAPPTPGRSVTADEVQHFPGTVDLYDIHALRTVFLEFENQDWEAEMTDFYRTDITVPAKMVVDGKEYDDVGVGFRGNSSFFTVDPGYKRSLSISINAKHRNQRLYGYRTLNLLNSHADPSFVREAMFTYVARNYLPTYKVNFVHVVINGQSWGVYVNSQQFNSDFTNDFFDDRGGARWKFPAGRNAAAGALVYLGPNKDAYRGAQLKTPEVNDAWQNLIELCRRLKETPTDRLDTDLDDILNVDRALWFLALDNLLIDGDGYLSRASDYCIYQDSNGRFHLLHYDSNETFRNAGGGGPGVRLPTAPGSGANLDPFVFATPETRDLADRPLVRLLDNPRLRMRYAAHVRTILDDWIGWDQLGPLYRQLTALIDKEVKLDTRKLYSYEQFASGGGGERGAPRIEDFINDRQLYLYTHNQELNKDVPNIASVAAKLPADGVCSKDAIKVIALTTGEVQADKMILYYSSEPNAPFSQVEMRATGGDSYVGTIPPFPVGSDVRFYVEARGREAASFYPTNTEMGALTYHVETFKAPSTNIVINEILTSNSAAAKDPQGEYEDYIELKNTSSSPVDVSGFYLTDNPGMPLKWSIPPGTVIPPHGYLLIWADEDEFQEDGSRATGLHANFKLAKRGETLMLMDRDDRDNLVLDQVTYANLRADVAYGRMPDGTGAFAVMHASAGAANQ